MNIKILNKISIESIFNCVIVIVVVVVVVVVLIAGL
jgi:hypothetical protein